MICHRKKVFRRTREYLKARSSFLYDKYLELRKTVCHAGAIHQLDERYGRSEWGGVNQRTYLEQIIQEKQMESDRMLAGIFRDIEVRTRQVKAGREAAQDAEYKMAA